MGAVWKVGGGAVGSFGDLSIKENDKDSNKDHQSSSRLVTTMNEATASIQERGDKLTVTADKTEELRDVRPVVYLLCIYIYDSCQRTVPL